MKKKRSGEMSKGRVWNKGKRNGGGGPPAGSGYKTKMNVNHSGNENQADKSSNTLQQGSINETGAASGSAENRIDRVVRMNRENWVARQDRVKREKPGNHS
jgi:hypothetical protein